MSVYRANYEQLINGGFTDFETNSNAGTLTITNCNVGDTFAVLFMTADGATIPYTAMDGVTATGADIEIVDHFNGTNVTVWGGIKIAGTWYKVVATEPTITFSAGYWNYIKLV